MEYYKRHLFEALTRWNYFPNQKSGVKELPPIVSSRRFTPEVASEVASERARPSGYGVVEYSSTRFNNIPRVLGLVHPRAHAGIVEVYNNNWDALRPVYNNANSMVKPGCHGDGRAFVMNYEMYEDKVFNALSKSFGKSFRVHADISNCFGSIYTHSVEWALRGFEETKRNMALKRQEQERHWSQDLDKALRLSKRNETQGIPIGPATSSLAVEIILGEVDRALSVNYEFFRYIDDYTCLCSTYEEAQNFLRDLTGELSKFKLTLNLHKTSIVSQPEPLQPAWVSDLVRTRPGIYIGSECNTRRLTLSEVVHFLDYAVRLNNETPDGSVLKFAVGSVVNHVDEQAGEMLSDYLANLAFHYPVLLPYLEVVPFPQGESEAGGFEEKLNSIALESARNGRSDGMAWSLYVLMKNDREIYRDTVDAVLHSRDCVSISILAANECWRESVLGFAYSLKGLPDFQLDEYWLLLYQLYYYDALESFYEDDRVFDVLKNKEVDFLPQADVLSYAEECCVRISAGFLGSHFMFDGFLKP